LPSTRLERRPDVAAAERRAAAANASIGIAVAAYYPDLTLSATYGFSGSPISRLFQAPNAVWSLGANLAGTLLDAGARSARVEGARAQYDQQVANYRQTVLTAFQEVEDQLVADRMLLQQAGYQARAVAAAREAERSLVNQYRAGRVSFTEVATAQASALSAEQTALGIARERLLAQVALVQALGGGWQAGPQ
jgi:NodT family efflux transporter outer membrane factor (OMF) lipoprotein